MWEEVTWGPERGEVRFVLSVNMSVTPVGFLKEKAPHVYIKDNNKTLQ
jgi:hypothetical protein